MMQEVLLFGQVPAENHQVLRQRLAHLTRMQPQPVLERHLIFKPFPPPGLSNLPAGSGPQGSQPQELQKTRQMLNAPLSYVQLVGVVGSRHSGSRSGEKAVQGDGRRDRDVVMGDNIEQAKQDLKMLQWYLEFRDIPEPGKLSATSRTMSRTRILEGDPIHFLNDLGYEYVSQYAVTGDKLYDQDITLFLHKVMQLSEHGLQDHKPVFPTLNTVPDIAKLTPLDTSGGYILQASLEIADGNSAELKDKAIQQILAMKETLRSSIDLVPGDRLALDTRVPTRRMR